MAGDWLQLDHDLPDKPEVLGIVARTAELPETVIGRLFKLWRLADRQTFDGVIPHATPKSLAAIVGGSHDFWEAVIEVGWLVPTPDGLAVPGFQQRFTQSAKRRMLDAKRKQSGRDADKCPHDERTDCGQMSACQADPESESVPIPESAPNPAQKPAGSASAEPRAARAAPLPDRSADIRSIFDHYRTYHPKAHPKPTRESKQWRLIAARLKGGYSVADICKAIDGCHKAPWNCGDNPDGKLYQDLDLIVRDDSKVARFMELSDKPREQPKRNANERPQVDIDAMEFSE